MDYYRSSLDQHQQSNAALKRKAQVENLVEKVPKG